VAARERPVSERGELGGERARPRAALVARLQIAERRRALAIAALLAEKERADLLAALGGSARASRGASIASAA